MHTLYVHQIYIYIIYYIFIYLRSVQATLRGDTDIVFFFFVFFFSSLDDRSINITDSMDKKKNDYEV